MTIDLKLEQQHSLDRPKYKYTFISKMFFLSMDILAGRRMSLAKAKLIEILATIPYRAWEMREYQRMSMRYKEKNVVDKALQITQWSRHAQDNEYDHLRIIDEKMKEDGLKGRWYLWKPVYFIMTKMYWAMSSTLAFFSIRQAFLFNAQFEDHAEHEYAEFVKNNPSLETEPVKSELVNSLGEYASWADVFRRIGLDERDHRNSSFAFAHQPDDVASYEGMPPLPPVE